MLGLDGAGAGGARAGGTDVRVGAGIRLEALDRSCAEQYSSREAWDFIKNLDTYDAVAPKGWYCFRRSSLPWISKLKKISATFVEKKSIFEMYRVFACEKDIGGSFKMQYQGRKGSEPVMLQRVFTAFCSQCMMPYYGVNSFHIDFIWTKVEALLAAKNLTKEHFDHIIFSLRDRTSGNLFDYDYRRSLGPRSAVYAGGAVVRAGAAAGLGSARAGGADPIKEASDEVHAKLNWVKQAPVFIDNLYKHHAVASTGCFRKSVFPWIPKLIEIGDPFVGKESIFEMYRVFACEKDRGGSFNMQYQGREGSEPGMLQTVFTEFCSQCMMPYYGVKAGHIALIWEEVKKMRADGSLTKEKFDQFIFELKDRTSGNLFDYDYRRSLDPWSAVYAGGGLAASTVPFLKEQTVAAAGGARAGGARAGGVRAGGVRAGGADVWVGADIREKALGEAHAKVYWVSQARVFIANLDMYNTVASRGWCCFRKSLVPWIPELINIGVDFFRGQSTFEMYMVFASVEDLYGGFNMQYQRREGSELGILQRVFTEFCFQCMTPYYGVKADHITLIWEAVKQMRADGSLTKKKFDQFIFKLENRISGMLFDFDYRRSLAPPSAAYVGGRSAGYPGIFFGTQTGAAAGAAAGAAPR